MNEVYPSNIFKPSLVLFTKYCTFCFSALSIFLHFSVTYAEIIHVPSNQATIQAAIDAASNGDIVLVSNGTYSGAGNKNIDFRGKAIIVQSENGPHSTIIDCQNDGRGFYFHSGESNNSILSGFTIKNGYLDEPGSGVMITDSSNPTIENCIINSNTNAANVGEPDGYGGGIYINGSSPIISNSIISDNSSTRGGGILIGSTIDTPQSAPNIVNCKIFGNSAVRGGGIYSYNSSPEITNSFISYNSAIGTVEIEGGGGIFFTGNFGGNPKLTNCILANNKSNYGGAINWMGGTSLTITNCTIVSNDAEKAGGAIYSHNWGSNVNIINSIFWSNKINEIDTQWEPNITYSTISGGWPGEGNLDLPPIFVDPSKEDFHLSNFSPCINAGKIEGAPGDDLDGNPRPNPNGSNPDMGAYENSLATPQIPSPADMLDIFGMELNNSWTYEGTDQGAPYSTGWKIIDINRSVFPVPTYIYEVKENGVVVDTEWYENAGDQIKLWQMTIEDEGTYYNISFSQGLVVAWAPMEVFDHRYSTATTDILGLTFNVSMTVDVLSTESVVLAFDTLEAYKVQYQFHLWGNGIDQTETFVRWIAPYLGTVKEQGNNYLLELTSFDIGSGSVAYPGDKDGDGLSDYDEFFMYNTHWLIGDSDDDGLNDGPEVLYWGADWNKDPDGDLFVNLVDPDSDNDGLSDGLEINALGTDPALADTDNDGTPDADEDTDGDRFTNLEELECGSDPADKSSRCAVALPWLMLLLD